MRRVLVLANPGGGRFVAADADALCDSIRSAFAAYGTEATVARRDGRTLAEAARAGLDGGWDAIVAAGGDGTLSCVAGVLAATATPMGVLPFGTLNHFARDLGVPLDLDGAVAAVAAGEVRAVDVASVNGRRFINNASIGVYPQIVADRARQQRDLGRGRWRAGAVAALRAIARPPHRRLTVRVDDREERVRTPLLFVGNGDYALSLPRLGRRARLDDGELSLHMLRNGGRFTLPGLALRAAAGRLRQASDLVSVTRARRVVVEAGPRTIRVALDGEVVTMRSPLLFDVQPRALRVLAPPELVKD